MGVKLILGLTLLLVALAYWLLPRTRIANRLHMSENFFYVMNILGIVCGLIGLIVTFGWPDLVMGNHFFEFILMPVVLIYIYSAMIMKVKKATEIYDEKQNYDMTRAAAQTWGLSIFFMFLIFAMYKENILEGTVWFPLFIFLTIGVYSLSTLYYFKRS